MKKYILLLMALIITGCSNTMVGSVDNEEKIIRDVVREEEDAFIKNNGKYKHIPLKKATSTDYWVDEVDYPETDEQNPARKKGYQIYFRKNGMIMSTGTVPNMGFDWRPENQELIATTTL